MCFILIICRTLTTISLRVAHLANQAKAGERCVDHWKAWQAPTGARLIRPDGTVEPRLLRSRINAVVNAETDSIVARASSVGTNHQDAELVIDGNSETCWAPEPKEKERLAQASSEVSRVC